MDSLVSQYLVKILNLEMDMPANSVWIREQNRRIPNDNGLYISVGFAGGAPGYNVVRMEEINGVQSQISEVQVLERIQIDIFSNSNSALTRNWEVIAALQSFYSQQIQELYNFKIFRIPSNWLDTSAAEGANMLKRFTITIACFVWYRKIKAMPTALGDYYNDFTQRVDDAVTIGTNKPMVEFEINSGGIVNG